MLGHENLTFFDRFSLTGTFKGGEHRRCTVGGHPDLRYIFCSTVRGPLHVMTSSRPRDIVFNNGNEACTKKGVLLSLLASECLRLHVGLVFAPRPFVEVLWQCSRSRQRIKGNNFGPNLVWSVLFAADLQYHCSI